MALTSSALKSANESIKTVNVKGKGYAMVQGRVSALRAIIPGAEISTEIVNVDDTSCIIKATIKDENGQVLATGHAWELSTSSQVNRTSYIENCETSAVGRALAFCGIGIDTSIASYDEVNGAIIQQEVLNDKLNKYAEIKGISVEEVEAYFAAQGVTSVRGMIDILTRELKPKADAQAPTKFERSAKT